MKTKFINRLIAAIVTTVMIFTCCFSSLNLCFDGLKVKIQSYAEDVTSSDYDKAMQLYKEKLQSLIEEGWTMEDDSMFNGSRFDFYDIDNNGIPELCVSHDNGHLGDGLIFSFINGKLVQANVLAKYGSITVNSDYSMIYCNMGTTLLPYPSYYKYDGGIITEISEDDECYSDCAASEGWEHTGYKYTFDSESIEKAFYDLENGNVTNVNNTRDTLI